MINLFDIYRKYKITYFATAFPLLFILLFCAAFTGKMWIILIAILLVFLETLALKALAKKHFKQYTDLYYNCQIAEYLKASEDFLSKAKKPVIIELFRNNIFTACMAQLDLDRAGRLVKTMQPNIQNVQNEIVYYSNICIYFKEVKDFAHAQAALDSLKAIVSRPNLPEKAHQFALQQIQSLTYALNLKQGNYDGAKAFFENELLGATSKLKQVSVRYHLQDICLHENNVSEAKEHLAFILENGGDSYYVEEAKRMMQDFENTKALQEEHV